MPVTTFHPTADASELAQVRADLDQLTEPHTIAVRQRPRHAGHRRNQWIALDHLPLLVQLRAATTPGNTGPRGPERRQVPRSAPACALDPLDALAEVYVSLGGWVAGLDAGWTPPADTDYQLAALQRLAATAASRSPELLDALTRDVHRWWHAAATWACCHPGELVAARRTAAPAWCRRCCPRCTPSTRCDRHPRRQ